MTPSSTVEFLVWMLIAASVIAVLAARLRIPYTVALVLGGLLLGSLHLPVLHSLFAHPPEWLTPDVSLVIFLPALLFEGSLKIQFRHLRESLVPICLLATLGVLAATLFAGFALHWTLGIPILIALVFGAIVAATDPISVLAIFKDMAVDKRLTVIVEGESLFNDGTAVVLYGILFAAVVGSHFSIVTGIRDFAIDVMGGADRGGGPRLRLQPIHPPNRRPGHRDHADHHTGLRFLSSGTVAAYVRSYRHGSCWPDDRQLRSTHRNELADPRCVVVVLGVRIISD